VFKISQGLELPADIGLGAATVLSCDDGTVKNAAGFWDRAIATIIDLTLLTAVVAFLLVPTAAGLTFMMARSPYADDVDFVGRVAGWLTYVQVVVLGWPYSSLLESSSWQATVGKRVLGLRVTDEAGNRVTLGAANRRYAAKLVSGAILGVGFLMAAFSERHQALHDRLTSTRVERREGRG
jgi:uncharacterized RDD family membrane protein YckC